MNNTMIALIRYFQSDEKPVTHVEFKSFWQSLTVTDKIYFVNVDLETGLMPTD